MNFSGTSIELGPDRMLERIGARMTIVTLVASHIVGLAFSSNSFARSGATSGGGGYVTKNSRVLLKTSSRELAQALKRSSPLLFKNFPAKWTQARYAALFDDVREMPLKDKRRDGSDLIFDYGVDRKGPYIAALRPFFHLYGSVPVKFKEERALEEIKWDIKLKLIHESGHLLGLNEDQSEEFSMRMLRAMESDVIHCQARVLQTTPRTMLSGTVRLRANSAGYIQMSRHFVISRPYAKAFYAPLNTGYYAGSFFDQIVKGDMRPGYFVDPTNGLYKGRYLSDTSYQMSYQWYGQESYRAGIDAVDISFVPPSDSTALTFTGVAVAPVVVEATKDMDVASGETMTYPLDCRLLGHPVVVK